MSETRIIDSYPLIFRALELDLFIPRNTRKTVFRFFLSIVLVSLVLALSWYFINQSIYAFLDNINVISYVRFLGVAFIALGLALFFGLIEFFYASNMRPPRIYARQEREYALSVELSRVLAQSGVTMGDPVAYRTLFHLFSETDFAPYLTVRLGIPWESFENFLNATRTVESVGIDEFFPPIFDALDKKETTIITMSDLFSRLYDADRAFAEFLFGLKIKKEDLVGAAEWIESAFDEETHRSQWWERDSLQKGSPLGKDLGYGYTYTLDRYSHDITGIGTHFARETRKREIHTIEDALSRSYEANILLVGEEGAGKHAVIDGLAQSISEGLVAPALVDKRIVVLDYQSVTASTKTKGSYEALMIKMFNEAVTAGNIVLVIENFPGFLASSLTLGVDAVELIESYIASNRIQVIALADPTGFHRELEPSGKIMKLFEKIDVEEPTPERALNMLEDAALLIEARSGRIFTFQALKHAFSLADRYIASGAMPEKAIDLLDEIASSAPKDKQILYPEDVEAIVEKRTHIPTMKAEAEEKDKLLNMEQLLHERMIDQEEALRVISDALRRARSGLKSTTRPIGTFLFLGPTGVGKTETAKALAQVYFGDEEAMFRFDMSEYSQEDGVEKLIGSRDSKIPGILASRLRERPFSLLLFDEFEKALRPVHNIFLQILDEGFFSDGAGKRVSARESMIIMTSNAGSNMILDLITAGKDSESIKGAIIDEIRSKNIFTPELLNRFDAIVLYKPLPKPELVKVAMLMLKGLQKKLLEQEITFEPTEELAARVVEVGYDPIFGARPMRRAVADRVEQVIAKKILGGELKRGDTFSFSKEEVAGL